MPITVNTTDTFEQWRLKTNDIATGLETNVTSVYSSVYSALSANIAAVNSNIASNVSTINSSITSNVSTINSSITSNVSTINSSINSNVATINSNITSNVNTKLSLSGGTMTGAITTVNGGVGINIGDDARLADRNETNTMYVEGIQNNDRGYINFSTTTNNALGAVNGGALTWRGATVLHSSNYNSYAPTLTGTGASGTWSITSACTNRPLLTAASNFFVVNTLPTVTSASYNVAVGTDAGCNLTSGNSNNFFGFRSGRCTTTGRDNTFFGASAGCGNTSGSYNNFFGFYAGQNNTTRSFNNFFGYFSGRNNTGSHNNFLGYYSGNSNSGCYNNFFGYCSGAGASNSGSGNNFMGYMTGRVNTTGTDNNFFGRYAGVNNTTGGYNIFFGFDAGCSNNNGNCNIFMGPNAGFSNTSGNVNIFMGSSAGGLNITGSYNTFIGLSAGYYSKGNNNLLLGRNAGTPTAFFGGLCKITTESNYIILGDNNNTCSLIKTAFQALSDIRDKCVFGPVPHGKGFLNKINPIKYAFKDRETGELNDIPGKRRYGFSAQEIAELEGDESVIVSKDNPDKYFLSAESIIPILVNAVKELTTDIEELKAEIAELKKSQ